MKTATICNPSPSMTPGAEILCTIDPYGTAIPARRTVNADGTPRQGLVRVRVLRIERDGRRFTGDMIRDGVRPTDRAICEVMS